MTAPTDDLARRSKLNECPHCGLRPGTGYAGMPLCKQPWGGSPEAKPIYPGCLFSAPRERQSR